MLLGRGDGTLHPGWLGGLLLSAPGEVLAWAGAAKVAASLQHGCSGGLALLAQLQLAL